ncbi:MAG TPA: FAD:protein FMN transferase [Acidimicrobiales bacterium]|nr:FAD:protein FMN transferase [Acidimicrobiales bacterium]
MGSVRPEDDQLVHTEQVMGTVVSFRVRSGSLTTEESIRIIGKSCELLHEVDAIFSTWRAESPLSRLRRGEVDIANIPNDISEVLELCEQAKTLSAGWFDPWAMPGGVDPTGLVKGWALDRAMRVLVDNGIESALVNAGGDLVASGEPEDGEPWRIGIRHPWKPESFACLVHLERAIATSGSYERGAHLIDPRTGLPSTVSASASVTGPNLAMADALATALAVGGSQVLDLIANLPGCSAYLILADGTELSNDDFPFIEVDIGSPI